MAPQVTRQVFEASKGRLKVVGRAGVGVDNVDLAAATEVGYPTVGHIKTSLFHAFVGHLTTLLTLHLSLYVMPSGPEAASAASPHHLLFLNLHRFVIIA